MGYSKLENILPKMKMRDWKAKNVAWNYKIKSTGNDASRTQTKPNN